MGSQLIHCLNNQKVISRFEAIVGKRVVLQKAYSKILMRSGIAYSVLMNSTLYLKVPVIV